MVWSSCFMGIYSQLHMKSPAREALTTPFSGWNPPDCSDLHWAFLALLHLAVHFWKSYTGWWLTYPCEKYESQLGLFFPIYGKIKNVPNHQPVYHSERLSSWISIVSDMINNIMVYSNWIPTTPYPLKIKTSNSWLVCGGFLKWGYPQIIHWKMDRTPVVRPACRQKRSRQWDPERRFGNGNGMSCYGRTGPNAQD